MRITTVWLASIVVLAATAGCASMKPDLDPPDLSLVSVGMVSGDIFSQQFRVRLRVSNPNDLDLPVESIDYHLFLMGDSFAEGESDAPFVVPALGETEFDMMVRTNFVSSIGRLLSRLETTGGRQVQYEFSGTVDIDLPFMGGIPFSDTGVVDLGTFR